VNVQDVFDATARTYDRARSQLVPCFDDFYRTALERMRADRMSPLAAQLRWLEEVGFRDVDCAYKNYRFAVYSGFK